RFRLYQTLSCPIPGRSGLLRYYFSLSSSSLSRFPFRRFRLYQAFSVSLTGVLANMRGRRTGLQSGLGSRCRSRTRSRFGVRQGYDSTGDGGTRQIVCGAPLGLSTGSSRAEPGLHMTYAADQYAAPDQPWRRPSGSPPLGGSP
ncbi:hypothetical protein FKO01_64140, partial [Mesorhizobium sp. B2-3-3]